MLLAACVAVTAVLGVLAARGRPEWLDSVLDPRFHALQARFPALVDRLPELGTLGPVTLMTLALVLACLATRRWSGAVLAGVATPVATALTEYVLKPLVGASFPSGHATSLFALAATCAVLLANPRHRVPWALRLPLALIALLVAAAVAAAMVAIGAHYFTEAVGGTAFGIGVVLACTLTLDLVTSRLRPRPAAPPAPGL